MWIGFLDQATTFAATIEYAISEDAGRTWGQPAAVAIPAGLGILNDPAPAVDSAGNFTLAALAFELPGQRPHSGIFVYPLPKGATAFGAPVAVDTLNQSSQLFYFDKPQIAVTSSGLLATYSLIGAGGTSGTVSRAGIAATSANGIAWQHDTIATNAPGSIAICPPGQSVMVVYRGAGGGLWTVSSTDGGLTWNVPVQIADATTTASFPDCVGRGNDTWVSYGVGQTLLGLLHSADGGAHFSPVPITIIGSVTVAQIGLRDDGSVDIAFYNSSPSVPFGFVHALLLPNSSTLGTPELIRGGLQIPTARQVQNGLVDFVGVIPSGIVFTDNSSGTSHIAFFREAK